jgi:hypothetical protein
LKVFNLFAAAPKDKWVAALKAHHALALLYRVNHEFFNKRLGGRLAPTALAHVNDASLWGGVGQYLLVDQIVHKQYGGLANGLDSFECEQLGVSGPSAYQGAGA